MIDRFSRELGSLLIYWVLLFQFLDDHLREEEGHLQDLFRQGVEMIQRHLRNGLVIEGSTGPVIHSHNVDEEWQLGVRPEHIHLVEQGIAATVDTIEYFGADTIVGCRVGQASLLMRVPGQLTLVPGDAIQLGWDHGSQYFFDKKSGLRRIPM